MCLWWIVCDNDAAGAELSMVLTPDPPPANPFHTKHLTNIIYSYYSNRRRRFWLILLKPVPVQETPTMYVSHETSKYNRATEVHVISITTVFKHITMSLN